MSVRPAILVGLVMALIGAAVTGGTLLPVEQPSLPTVSVGGTRTLLCPTLGSRDVTVTATALGASSKVLPLGGKEEKPSSGLVTVANAAAPVVLTGPQDVSGVSSAPGLTGAFRGLWLTACRAPEATLWFPGLVSSPTARVDLVLTNPDAGDAVVDLRLLTDTGLVDPPDARDLLVPGRGSRVVALSDLTTSTATVSVVVRASEGRVFAVTRLAGQAGGDWQTPAADPAADLTIPGVPGGAGPRVLSIANPGERRATVTVYALASGGSFQPAVGATLDVDAGSTATVDLAESLREEGVSLRLTSTQPVTAAVRAETGGQEGDLAVAVATAPLLGQARLPVAGTGVLSLANPADASVTVAVRAYDAQGKSIGDVTSQTLEAGVAVEVPVRPGWAWVELTTTSQQVRAALVLTRLGPLAGLGWAALRSGAAAGTDLRPVLDPRVGA